MVEENAAAVESDLKNRRKEIATLAGAGAPDAAEWEEVVKEMERARRALRERDLDNRRKEELKDLETGTGLDKLFMDLRAG